MDLFRTPGTPGVPSILGKAGPGSPHRCRKTVIFELSTPFYSKGCPCKFSRAPPGEDRDWDYHFSYPFYNNKSTCTFSGCTCKYTILPSRKFAKSRCECTAFSCVLTLQTGDDALLFPSALIDMSRPLGLEVVLQKKLPNNGNCGNARCRLAHSIVNPVYFSSFPAEGACTERMQLCQSKVSREKMREDTFLQQ